MNQTGAKGIFDQARTPQPQSQPTNTKPNIVDTRSPGISSGQSTPETKKVNFETPEETLAQKTNGKAPRSQDRSEGSSDTADRFNRAFGGTGSIDDEINDLDSVTPEDLEIVSQVLFKGYAEKNYEFNNMPNTKATICTTSAEDMSIIDDILFDIVKRYEDKDGNVDTPQSYISTMRTAVWLALSYKGLNGEDICNSQMQRLDLIKAAIKRLSILRTTGDMAKASELLKDVKKAVLERTVYIRQLPTPVIDFLSGKKINFDTLVLKVMNTKDILSKS
jgi:hypothetical protein